MKYMLYLASLLFLGCGIPTLNDIILRPNKTIETTPADLGYDYEEVYLPIDDERGIVVWHVFSEESKALIVILPGSDANKSRYVEGLPIFVEHGYDVILFDYTGFGSSPGIPSLPNCVADAYTVAKYALEQHDNVVLFGVSLGTPLVMNLASIYEFDGCILEGTLILYKEAELWLNNTGVTMSFFWDVANAYIYPQVPVEYDILKYAPLVEEPKLFMQSVEDETTPFAGAVEVFDLSPEPKEFFEMIGEHGKMIRINPELYTHTILDWLERLEAK